MLTRRSFLTMALRPEGPPGDVLVQVFLRGGADGLNLVAPYADPGYRAARPTLALGAPDAKGGALDLDGRFGLHPVLAPLVPLWRAGELAIVHAAGSDDSTRSHFEAQDLMERGNDPASGWIARHLRTAPGRRGALSAVAIADVMPESLRGSPGASAVPSLEGFSLRAPEGFERAVAALYESEAGDLGASGRQVLQTLGTVERLRSEGAGRDPGSLAGALEQVGRLVRAEVGLEAACVDLNGWDTHFVQGTLFDGLARELGEGLSSFWAGLGEFRRRVTVVVMTEFGRRVAENVSFGTDHGRGGAMFVLGRGLSSKRVLGEWPGLGPEVLEGPGDLPVTTDYRDVLGELVAKRLGNPEVRRVFPGREPKPVGVVAG